MKKNFLFFSLFLLIFSNLLLLVPRDNKLFFNENRDSQVCGSGFTDVTTADEFMNAANANENICVVNDIDFSEIPSDQSIETYSGIIDGQFNTLSNHNYDLEYNENEMGIFENYLFINFNGTIKNVTFENFPFIFEHIDGQNSGSEFNLENIIFTNYDIENLYYIIDRNIEQSFGLISKTISNTNSKNLSFTNIKFNNNQIYVSTYDGNNSSSLYFSLFSSKINSSNFSELYFMNIEFLNNIINTSIMNFGTDSESLFTDVYSITRLGILFTADGTDINMEDIFINSLNFSNNNIIATTQLKLGFLYGNFISINQPAVFARIYETNCIFENNTLKFKTGKFHWGTLIGYSKSSISINFDSVVVNQFSGDASSNLFYNISDDSQLELQNPGELVGTDEIPANTFYNQTYYINDTGTGDSPNYLYTTIDNLTLDFWINTVNFDESAYNAWNLEILFDENLNISKNTNDQGEIYGFPLFVTFNYLNTTIDSTGDNYIINYNYVPSESVTYSAIRSIFDDEFLLEYGEHTINSGISTLIPLDSFISYYWIDLQRDNLNETNIVVGDFTSQKTQELYTDDSDITNEIDLSLSGDEIYYEHNVAYDTEKYQNIIFDDDFSNQIKIIDENGTETILSDENPSLTVPSYVNSNNINSFYKIELNDNNSLSYINPNKELAKVDPTFIGDLTNTSDDFEIINEPYFEYEIDYKYNDQGRYDFYVYLELIDENEVAFLNEVDPETEVLTIGSAFAQFDDDLDEDNYKTTITLSDFANYDEEKNQIYCTIELDPLIPVSQINNYYWIEENNDFSLKYYSNLAGDLSTNSDGFREDILASDLTNTNPVSIYDLNQNFQLEINTTYDQDLNTLSFELVSLNEYSYDLYYNVNLVLKNSESSTSFNLSKNNDFYSIELDSSLPYNLEKDPSSTINDYYSLELDSSKDSFVIFINQFGQLELLSFNNLVTINNSNQPKLVDENIYLNGDLNNLDSNVLEPIISKPTQGDISYKILLIMVILFILFLISYIIISTISYRTYKR